MVSIKQSHSKIKVAVNCVIIVISDSLSLLGDNWLTKDKSGTKAKQFLERKGITVIDLMTIPDDITRIQAILNRIFTSEEYSEVNFILTIGGTGIAQRDVTIESVAPLLDKELPGFGEIFRYETYKLLKTVAIMSRAIAGVKGGKLICCLPGSPNAVQLGLELIEPEFVHILNLRLR